MRNFDFTSWQGVLSTLVGIALFALVGIGIRLLMMTTIQQRQQRQNRQINERLRTLIAAYKVLGGSFTGRLSVDPRHLRDIRAAERKAAEQGGEAVAPRTMSEETFERVRLIRDAVEAALSDIILLGTDEQVRLAAKAARDLAAGNEIHTHELVVSLRNFIRVGKSMGISVELITRKDYATLAEYDALFIRETTAISNHTYRFAKKAESEGMVVIDDPTSIMRCTNKVYLADLLQKNRIPAPKTRILQRKDLKHLDELVAELGLPMVLKIPDGSFSRGVVKVSKASELLTAASELLKKSDLILAQEFLYTEYDWRIGVLNKKPIFACQYFMSKGHWQIYEHGPGGEVGSGGFKTFPTMEVPPQVIKTAVKAASLIGDGLYGVDLKQNGNGCYVIEVNDNPNIDSGVEDQYLKDELYRVVLEEFVRRLELRHNQLQSF
mgnify:CR=1 FL=1